MDALAPLACPAIVGKGLRAYMWRSCALDKRGRTVQLTGRQALAGQQLAGGVVWYTLLRTNLGRYSAHAMT